ncbi:protein EXECUTER 1, chloroplastic-like [Juglans regia]|uniref:Protein EXECUTER 1, chloroplastic-like n=1 Tax=Juglans regia TaxID=51240 RepID=A0A2I4DVS7_JUGRE|nr:protein EXECUTER 1, chloroplastic-like [Juglans regia]XP_018811247.2 protein EXECUTER 1, chloroplastic-like [Juglans regia]XP_035540423.1 protein EXECUTER 1, chloroplastic-like [Juglans regia]
MASISPPTSRNLVFPNPKFLSPPPLRRPSYPSQPHSLFISRISDSFICRSHHNASSSPDNTIRWRWDSLLHDVVKTAIERFNSYFNSNRKEADDVRDGELSESRNSEEEEWDWDRWGKHFDEIDGQECLASILKSKLGHAAYIEDYEDAARLKVAIAAAATNDTVGRVMSHLNKAIEEERFQDAAYIQDNAGAGLVGWWAGIAKDINDPHGLIIRITAEHGRYVARSYSPQQLATAAAGVPLFEVFLTVNKRGEYKQKAVYLERRGVFEGSLKVRSKTFDATSSLNPLDSTEDKGDLFAVNTEDPKDGDDRDDSSDLADGLSGFQNILKDMIPGVKVKVLKVTAPGKLDRDLISKVMEQIIEEEDEEKDNEIDRVEAEDQDDGESDQEADEIEMDADPGIIEREEQNEIAVKAVVGGLVQKLSNSLPTKDLLRIPAKLEKKGRFSFSLSIEKSINEQDSGVKKQASVDKSAKPQGQHKIDHVMLDLAKFIGREKIPLKVLKDVGELIKLTLSQAQNYQPLSGSTTFNSIKMPTSTDPLSGLYIGAHGLSTSEVIHLSRKFGQWQEDGGKKKPSDLEFYEYVEAIKLIGDPYVPAGEVAFRAKVGKRHQLPLKGIIPEELGVIARYKGQGRLAEPGFHNPRWVDGELVILDGKYVKGGPVVGFVYWAPEYHLLVFFNRLRLQE